MLLCRLLMQCIKLRVEKMIDKLTIVSVRFRGSVCLNEMKAKGSKPGFEYMARYLSRRDYGRNLFSHNMDWECGIAYIVRIKSKTVS